MKLKTVFILVLALCTCTSTISFAQSRAEKRAKNLANQNVDRKIDESVDNAFNKIEGLFKKKNKKKKKKGEKEQTTSDQTPQGQPKVAKDTLSNSEAEENQEYANNILKRMGGNNEPWEPIKNDFPFSFESDMTMTDKKGKITKMSIKYVFDTWKTGMHYTMEDGTEMQMILDNQEGSIITVTDQDGERQGFKMRQQKVNLDDTDFSPTDDGIIITKTGRTKTTEGGYFAHEYEVTTEDGSGTTWATEDVPIDMLRAMQTSFSQYSRGKMNKKQNMPAFNSYGIKGFPVENHFVDKKGKEKVDMIMKNLKTGSDIDKSPLDINGVKIMSMGF